MKLISLLRGNRYAHREAAEHLTSAARYWLPGPRQEMEVRRLVDAWIAEGRRAAERLGR